MRDYILQEIRRLADANGQAPGQKLFASQTGIAPHQRRGRFWSRWGDALADAGFDLNKLNSRSETSALQRVKDCWTSPPCCPLKRRQAGAEDIYAI